MYLSPDIGIPPKHAEKRGQVRIHTTSVVINLHVQALQLLPIPLTERTGASALLSAAANAGKSRNKLQNAESGTGELCGSSFAMSGQRCRKTLISWPGALTFTRAKSEQK